MAGYHLCCCIPSNRIHPLENLLNFDSPDSIIELERVRTVDTTCEQLESPTSNGCRQTNTNGDRLVTAMGSAVGQTAKIQESHAASDAHRSQAEISAVHAAAVNGDKSSLSKLLDLETVDINARDKFGRTPLMYCILADRPVCAEMLIKAGCDVNRKDFGGRTSLHWAAQKANAKCLKLLLERGASRKEKDNDGHSALHLSAKHKSPQCLMLLLKELELGEIDDQNNAKRTALHWAAAHGNVEHVRLLIKQNSNVCIPDSEGKTPLHLAASSKDSQAVDCVQLILEVSPSVMNWQDYEGRTALHLAVAEGNEGIVEALTAMDGCNINALDNIFRTPLHWAACLGHSSIVRILLQHSVDWVSSDSNGATALHYAAQNNFADTVAEFLSSSDVKDEPDLEGRTAFMWAAGKGADDVMEVFIRHGADIAQVDKNGSTVLHAAAQAGHVTTVKLLLKVSLSQLEYTDIHKHTPLMRTCEMGHLEVLQALLDAGAKLDIVDQDCRSLLHWAALGGHAYICQTLLKYGLDPNVTDISGRTPLHCASYGGYVNCMSVLLENSAQYNVPDNGGMTSLHWACSCGHLEAVKLLIKHRAYVNLMEFSEERYTALDYALVGRHYDVAQYMMECGALSITGIQAIAASKIQAVYRGYRVRKTFLERKKLLMKHEQLRKDAARKKAEEYPTKAMADNSDNSPR